MTIQEWEHGRRTPGVTSETSDYWEGGAQGELRIQHCSACSVWQHPPSPVCRTCKGRSNLSARVVSGLGHVASWTQNNQPWYPGQQVPFHVGYVELLEQSGLFVFGGLVGFNDMNPIGRAVKTLFHRQGTAWLPIFHINEETE